MEAIRGVIESSTGANFVGHRVQIEFNEPVDVEGMVPAGTRTAVRTAAVESDGSFSVPLPAGQTVRGPVSVSYLAPDGTILKREVVAETTAALRTRLAPAASAELVVHPDALKGQRARLTGRVFDERGGRPHRTVRILARRSGSPADGPMEVVFDARSTAGGYFTGEYPRGPFAAAQLEVEGSQRSMPIALRDGALPRSLPVVVELPPDDMLDDCACDDAPPRAPDPEDLALGGDAFTQDLGNGCTTLSKANRVLEEYDYFRVVRTTEPELYQPGTGDRDLVARALVRRAVPTLRLPAADTTDGDDTMALARPLLDARTAIALTRTAAADAAFGRLRRVLGNVLFPDGRVALDSKNPVEWDGPADLRQAATIAHGHLLHFRQLWRADGYSLGDLIYSLPLAPNQQKQIAILDWERRQVGQRAEDVDAAEQLRAALARDRDINEIVTTSLGEQQAGSSEAQTSASSGGFSLPGLFTSAWSSGSASSAARQDSARDLTATSVQDLHDRVMQAAADVRSQRSTVVQSVAEGETVNAQTEVVGNYNHCHAITVEYFEVLRHFLVTHDLVEVRECLLVPLIMELFDADKARRWRDPLAKLLRDPSLAAGFGALDRLARPGRTMPHADEPVESIQGQVRLRLRIARPRGPRGTETFDDWSSIVWSVFARISPANARAIYDQLTSADGLVDDVWQEQYAPAIARNYLAGLRFVAVDRAGAERPLPLTASIGRYIAGKTHTVRINANARPGLARRDITAVLLRSTYELPPNSTAAIAAAQLEYQTSTDALSLIERADLLDDLAVGDDVYLATPPSAADLADPQAGDERVRDRLLDHLNDHLEYYHRLIWQRMDPARRYLLLDGFRAPDDSGRSLASVVENRVVGVVGNSLVFPVVAGVRLDPTYRPRDASATLLDLYAPLEPPPGFRVTVPTRGVFAEAVMGGCNACEEKDESRFWRYDEAPPPALPTAIQPISTDSRRGDTPDLKASPLPNPIVNIQNAPAAPDPGGLAAALRVISTPNVFRDVTGLTENQRNALSSLQTTAQEAQAILASNNKFATDVLRSFTGGGSTGGTDQQTRQQNATRSLDKTMAAIKGAMRDGLISRDEARNLATTSLRQATGADTMMRRATDEPAVKNLLASAAARPQSSVTLVRPDETLSVSQGGDPTLDPTLDPAFQNASFDGFGDPIATPFTTAGGSPSDGSSTAISNELDTWLRSAANDVAFFSGADVTSYFMATTGQTFEEWFSGNVGSRGAWAIDHKRQAVRKNIGTGPAIHDRFERIWDLIPAMFGEDSATLLQFACLVSLFINEVGAELLPITEKAGTRTLGPLAYLFNAAGKKPYNKRPNRTAFENFTDPVFIAAHGTLQPGPRLARTSDRRWAGTVYPSGEPDGFNTGTAFIQQADFCKFRGRGLIQNTWRPNYKDVIRIVQDYDGDDPTVLRYQTAWRDSNGDAIDADVIATRSRNADWDDLFQNSSFEIPCLAVGVHNKNSGRYLQLANELVALNSEASRSIYNVGLRVSGASAYGYLFRRRVIQMLEALMNTPAATNTTDPMPSDPNAPPTPTSPPPTPMPDP